MTMKFFSIQKQNNDKAVTRIRSTAECEEAYQKLRETSAYPWINPISIPGPATLIQQVLLENQQRRRSASSSLPNSSMTTNSLDDVKNWEGKLAVVTGVFPDSVAYYVAHALVTVMHIDVILLGKSHSKLEQCRRTLLAECKDSKTSSPQSTAKASNIYIHKYNLASLESIFTAAVYVNQVVLFGNKKQQQQESFSARTYRYENGVSLLMNLAMVGCTNFAKLTTDGIEYNTGCNFIGTYYFTELLLPLLEQNNAPSETTRTETIVSDMPHDSKKRIISGRVVNTSTISHCLGVKFRPDNLVRKPTEGGAPDGYIVTSTITEDNWSSDRTNRTSQLLDVDGTDGSAVKITTSIVVNETEDNYSKKDIQQAVERSGTQLGRSKMALTAATLYLNHYSRNNGSMSKGSSISDSNGEVGCSGYVEYRIFDMLPPHRGGNLFSMLHCTNEQVAGPALRAALFEYNSNHVAVTDMDDSPISSHNHLFHIDGTMWHPFPLACNFDNGRACVNAAEEVLSQLKLATTNLPPPMIATGGNNNTNSSNDNCDSNSTSREETAIDIDRRNNTYVPPTATTIAVT